MEKVEVSDTARTVLAPLLYDFSKDIVNKFYLYTQNFAEFFFIGAA
jgi:hypothetical protein